MCVSLGGIRESMGRCAAGFDAALVSAGDAASVVADAAAIEKMAATVKALAAARVADTGVWRAGGDRSAAHHLARTTGTTAGAAAGAIDTARRLASLPATAAAARRGELSGAQVGAIADAAGADPGAEARLVDQARRTSLQELKDDCARTKAAASDTAEAMRRRIHERRYLRTYTDAEGAWHLHVNNNPEVGAEIMAVIDPLRDAVFAAARAQGRREPTEAYAADALTEMARTAAASKSITRPAAAHGAPASMVAAATTDTSGSGTADAACSGGSADAADSGGSADTPVEPAAGATPAPGPVAPGGATAVRGGRAKIIVRVDLGALLRGYPISGEVAELVGFGPVAVSAIHDLLDTGDPFVAAVATRGVDVVGVAHLGRRPTAHQRTALEWLYPTCAVEGCSAVARLEMDHRHDWAATHVTLFALLDRLCAHHHRLKTRENWALVDGRGKRAFVAPTDARHPRQANDWRRPPIATATGPPAGG